MVVPCARAAKLLLAALVALVLSLPFVAGDTAYAVKQGAPASKALQVAGTHSKVKAANVRGKASSATVFFYGWKDGAMHAGLSASTSKYDVTGDAKSDSINIAATEAGVAGLASEVRVTVNGSAACILRFASSSIDQASVRVITLRNNRPFLFVSAFGADGSAYQALLQYRSGTFEKIVDNGLLSKRDTSNAFISKAKPTGNRIILQYEFASTVTGITRTSFTYAYKNGTLARTSNTTSALLFATTKSGAYTKQARTAVRAFAAYKDVALSRKAFSVPSGKKARPLAIRLSGDRLLYKMRYGKKVGWVKGPDAGAFDGGGPFSNVYGWAPLEETPPAYSAAEPMTVSDLQDLSNHALYLARNEIFARHGFSFETAELKAYFSAKPWYSPNARGASALNAVELANAELILDIEHARRSPYAS